MSCFDFDLLIKQCFLGDEKSQFSDLHSSNEFNVHTQYLNNNNNNNNSNYLNGSNFNNFASSIEEFTPHKKLVQGRFGITYLGHHITTEKIVAIHTYSKSVLNDTCQNHIPNREKQLLESMNHPYILKVLDALSDNNSLYLITELRPCVTLSYLLDFAASGSGIEEKYIISYAACIVSVLKYCHSKNIIHRGLHPDSILIDNNGLVKVADWGFAKVVTERTYTLCGHVEYLSPEAICGETGYGRGADYWALGVLIFEMLVGRSAFAPFEETQYDSNIPSLSSTTSSPTIQLQQQSSSSPPPTVSSSHDSLTIDNILSSDPNFPSSFPHPAKSIIQGLCAKNVSQRLGCRKGGKGIEDIASHFWFRQNYGIDWVKLDKGQLSRLNPLPVELFTTIEQPVSLDKLVEAPKYLGYNCWDWKDFKPSKSLSSCSYSSSTSSISSTSSLKQSVSPTTVVNLPTHRRIKSSNPLLNKLSSPEKFKESQSFSSSLEQSTTDPYSNPTQL